MTVVAVSDSNLRREDFEGSPSFTSIGGGAGPSTNVEIFYEGAQCGARRIASVNLDRGFWVTVVTATDMTAAGDTVLVLKAILTNPGALNAAGLKIRLGSDQSNYEEYKIADEGTWGDDSDFVYPPIQGYIILPIDPNVSAWKNLGSTGAPAFTAVDEFAITGNISALALGQGLGIDAIDIGDGLWLVSGTGADPEGNFLDFLAADEGEGSSTADRSGHMTSRAGQLFCFGKLVVGRTSGGTVTATEFTDAFRTLVFPGGWVAAGWNELEFDISDAATVVDLSNITIVGQGRDDLKRWFDSSADQVDDVNEEFDIVAHGFNTGDAVLYSDEGGTAITGLTDATEYFVERVTADSFSLHATLTGALDATTPVGVTAAGTGEQHSFRRQPDTRPDVTFTDDASPGSADVVDCTFQNCRIITLTDQITLLRASLVTGKLISMVGGFLTDSAVIQPLLAEGEAYLLTLSLANVSGTSFEAGEAGHAIEIDTAGTYTFDGNSFTGYGATATFNASTGVDGGTEVITTDLAHGFADGEAVYYGDEGGTPIGGLTDGNRFYVNEITATTLSLHVTRADAEADANRINLTAGSSETHHLYSAHAAILNSSGGLVTINVSNGIAPSIRNTPGSTTVVNVSVNITINQVVANSQVAIYRVSDDFEIFNEEVVPASRFWWERFEADPGYDNVWSAGETISGTGAVVDEDQVTSGITGNPDRWQNQALRIVTPSTLGSAFVRNDFVATEGNDLDAWCSVDVILTSESLANGESINFFVVREASFGLLVAEFSWLQNTSGELRIQANIEFDGSSHLFESDIIIALDRRYTVDFKWDDTNNLWEWRLTDYSRATDGALVGPVTQDSGVISGSPETFDLIDLGNFNNTIVTTFYMDRIAIDNTDWTYERATLEDLVIPFDYGSGPDVTVRIELRKSQFAPKYLDKTILGTITSSGLTVNADQQTDDIAATP